MKTVIINGMKVTMLEEYANDEYYLSELETLLTNHNKNYREWCNTPKKKSRAKTGGRNVVIPK